VTDVGLADKILGLHAALGAAELPHAFGGALALAYCTNEPRGTKDIDVNVFIGAERLDELVAALPAGIEVSASDRVALERDGQTRLWWTSTPVDVFLSNHSFHDHAEASTRVVPFAGIDDLPVLACADLAVFKAFFGRAKDAVDVAAMVGAGAVDRSHLQRTITALLGEGERDRFFARVDDALTDG
jgi:hypothetical protein